MTREQAIAALNDEWAQGDLTPHQYAVERERIEYEEGERQSAMDDRRVVA